MIKVIQADITTLAVDAIVNAANELMLGGGGVDGAIHDAAGEELFNACLKVPEVRPGVRCPTGEARITPGFRPSRLSVWGLDLAPIMKQFAPVLGIEYVEDNECRELHQVYGEFVELMKSQQGGR